MENGSATSSVQEPEGLEIPEFLKVENRKPLTPEQKARLDAAIKAGAEKHVEKNDNVKVKKVPVRPSNTVIDAQGHKWKLRFTQYQQGWTWQAEVEGLGLGMPSTSDPDGGPFFASREEARVDANRRINDGRDHVAMAKELIFRLKGKTECQLTAEDHEAIERAGDPAQGVTTAATTSEVVHEVEKPVARPLRVLATLITEDLAQGEAAERAGKAHYRAAGEKMIEARGQMNHGEFTPWLKQHFKISKAQAYRYIALAEAAEKSPGETFTNLKECQRRNRRRLGGNTDAERARLEAERVREEAEGQAQNREALRKLALRIIGAGYRALALKRHPDNGGNQDAMVRLNAARDHLKQLALGAA
jgi:hypothetical protein